MSYHRAVLLEWWNKKTGRCFINSISILGSGWLSLPLARQLAQQNHRVCVSTRSPDKQAELTAEGYTTHLVDIASTETIPAEFLDSDTLIIAITSKDIDSYKKLIPLLASSPIKHVLFISSSSVYQNLNREVSEDEGVEDTQHPLYQIETLLRESPGFSTSVIRFSGLVGPNRHPGRFFRGGKTVKQPDAPINLIHLDDCLKLIQAVIDQSAWGDVFNGCSDTHPKKRDFYSETARSLGRQPPVYDTDATLSFKQVSNEKIKQKLKLQLKYPDLAQLTPADYE